MKQEIYDWLEVWLVSFLTYDSITPNFLVSASSLSESESHQIAVDFMYAGLKSGILELLPQGVLFKGGEFGFHGPLDYAQELRKFNPFDYDEVFAGRVAWGGPQVALSALGREVLENSGLSFGDTVGDDKAENRKKFLDGVINQFESLGVNLGDSPFILEKPS
ncbi:hypothetical protein [Roseateles depolymerans]|uniref:hypothetical protein n=1 Tax=Roseateles depolymerans TaxID=76731 RepID=UPI0011C06FAF|nr:hypothetical protein [Roseateles depolymerans]